MDNTLPGLWYWLNSNIYCVEKASQNRNNLCFQTTFYEIWVRFLFEKNEGISNNKNHHHVSTIFVKLMTVVFLLQDNTILLRLESLKKWYDFHGLICLLKCRLDILRALTAGSCCFQNVSSSINCCKPNWDVIVSILESSYVVVSCLYQVTKHWIHQGWVLNMGFCLCFF